MRRLDWIHIRTNDCIHVNIYYLIRSPITFSYVYLHSIYIMCVFILQKVHNTIKITTAILSCNSCYLFAYFEHFHAGSKIMAHQMSSSFIPFSHPSFLPSYFLPSWTQVRVLQLQLTCIHLLRPSVKGIGGKLCICNIRLKMA